jgi:thioredoxin reductase (NADPH)
MRDQAAKYGALREPKRVTGLTKKGEVFEVHCDDQTYRARTVLLATGVVNNQPDGMDEALHAEALARGLLRYCPICDGYEVTDKRVGVIGTGDHGTAEAQFLRGYTADITLISPHGDHDLDDTCSRSLDDAGIARVAGPCGDFAIKQGKLAVDTAEGRLAWIAAPMSATKAASSSAITWKPACPACSLQETWWSASTRSATPWARPASRRRRSATTWRKNARCGARSRRYPHLTNNAPSPAMVAEPIVTGS